MGLLGLLLMCVGHQGGGEAGLELQSFLSVAFIALIAQGWKLLHKTRYFPWNEGAGTCSILPVLFSSDSHSRAPWDLPHGICLWMLNSNYLMDHFSYICMLPDYCSVIHIIFMIIFIIIILFS